jgi:hypothetical protein
MPGKFSINLHWFGNKTEKLHVLIGFIHMSDLCEFKINFKNQEPLFQIIFFAQAYK